MTIASIILFAIAAPIVMGYINNLSENSDTDWSLYNG